MHSASAVHLVASAAAPQSLAASACEPRTRAQARAIEMGGEAETERHQSQAQTAAQPNTTPPVVMLATVLLVKLTVKPTPVCAV